jgi:hypothetical protein
MGPEIFNQLVHWHALIAIAIPIQVSPSSMLLPGIRCLYVKMGLEQFKAREESCSTNATASAKKRRACAHHNVSLNLSDVG